jgi:CubicO group peptidase (beta-lactamase class C family)
MNDIGGVEVSGYFDEKFASVVELFAENIREDRDVGASFALSVDGEMVLDIWGGHLDEARTSPWQENSIVNVFSSTKTVAFLCAVVLASRGQLDFDACVTQYWPEFGQAGKENVKVWHLMDHAAGLSGMDIPIGAAELYDWEFMCAALAAQAPWWEPGTATAYHAITQGHLLGEVVNRITGKSIGTFLAEDIAGPLGADFHIGVPDSEFDRIGNLIADKNAKPAVDRGTAKTIGARTFASPIITVEDSWTAEWRRAEIPACNGHGNARSLVRLQTPLACGGSAFGVDLLDEKTARSIMTPRISGVDMAFERELTFGLGFALNRSPALMCPNKNAGYWGGWGGSSILVDQDARIAVSYVMNQMIATMLGDSRSFELVQETYKQLG